MTWEEDQDILDGLSDLYAFTTRGFLQGCFLALLLGHQHSEEDMALDCPKLNNPLKNSYLKFSGGLFHLIYL